MVAKMFSGRRKSRLNLCYQLAKAKVARICCCQEPCMFGFWSNDCIIKTVPSCSYVPTLCCFLFKYLISLRKIEDLRMISKTLTSDYVWALL